MSLLNEFSYRGRFTEEKMEKKTKNQTYWAFIIFRSFMFQCVHDKCIAPLEHHSTLRAFVLSFYFIVFRGLSFGLFHFFSSLYQLHGNLSWKKVTHEWTLLRCTLYFLCKLVLKADVSVCYYTTTKFCSVYLAARKLLSPFSSLQNYRCHGGVKKWSSFKTINWLQL